MNNKTKTIAALLSLTCSAMAAVTLSENGATEAYVPFVKENVAPVASFHEDNAYAYAPATVYHNGYFHQFYCSTGNVTDRYYAPASQSNLVNSLDVIRYRYSKNGSDWSSPTIALSASYATKENRACDPAIVYDERDKYWYLFYQGAINNYGGAIYVSRSKNIKGPYEKYTHSGWMRMGGEAAPILQKWTGRTATNPAGYGIGQISVVRQGGKFHVWFNHMMRDDFVVYNSSNQPIQYARRYHIAVDNILDLRNVNMGNFYNDPTDPRVDFVTHIQKDTVYNNQNEVIHEFPAYSDKWHLTDFGEVRWNANAGRFEMWLPDKNFDYMMRIQKYYSTNGYQWNKDNSYNVAHQDNYMSWINNIGVSGDKFGRIINDRYLLSFSAPRNSGTYDNNWLNNNGYMAHDPETGIDYVSLQRGIWPMWEILNGANWVQHNINYSNENTFNGNTTNRLRFFVGDFDGDGIDALGAVEELRTKNFKWYIGSSKSSNGRSPIWGETLFSRDGYPSYQIITGDYDGDGKTDFGVVAFKNNKSYWNIHSSITGNAGVQYIPANFMVSEISPTFTILSGDYNGDGKADLAAFQTSTKKWYMRSSIDGTFMNLNDLTYYGLTGTGTGFVETTINSNYLKPIVGDFDGDHITDFALADSVVDAWYIRSSFSRHRLETGIYNGCRVYNWPLYLPYNVNSSCEQQHANMDHSSYQFLAGDFDGDGIDDKLIVHRTSGAAKAIMSRGGYHNFNIAFSNVGLYGSDPLQFLVGDFDGNGYSDFCVVNTATRKYYIKFFSSNGASITTSNSKSRTVKYVDFSTTYPLSKKAVKPAKPEIAQEKAMPSFEAYVQDQKLVVSNTLAGQKVVLFDLRGKEISHKVSNGLDMTFDIPNKGMYIVRSGDSFRKISIK